MPNRGALPGSTTQGYSDLEIEYVDQLPGGRAYLLLAGRQTAACFAVQERFTPEAQAQAAEEIQNLASLGLWPHSAPGRQSQAGN